MEDQQSETTDLTEETPTAVDVEPSAVEEDAVDDTDETAADAEASDEEAGVLGKPAGRRRAVVVGAAAALFVGAGAFAGVVVQPYLADRASVDTKMDVARTAANTISTLWTYTPADMETLPDRSAQYLAGDFQAQYRKYVDAVAPTNKQAQVSSNTQVVGAAVESLDGPDATAIVYTNTTTTSPQSKNIPALKYLSFRLTMKRENARWFVTRMTTITSLNLTPQL